MSHSIRMLVGCLLPILDIMRWDMPAWEVILGVMEVFILGWLFGAIVATLYNFGAPPSLVRGGESGATGHDAPVLARSAALRKEE